MVEIVWDTKPLYAVRICQTDKTGVLIRWEGRKHQTVRANTILFNFNISIYGLAEKPLDADAITNYDTWRQV